MRELPRLFHTVLDAEDPRALAEFYRDLFGLTYRGDEDDEWVVLLDADGSQALAFQRTERLTPTTWPSPEVPMQLHLDFTVSTIGALEENKKQALELGARMVMDRSDDEEEPLYVFADPAGHPFCIFVR